MKQTGIDREKVWLKYNKHCAYCGNEIKFENMQVDHLTPQRSAHFYKSKSMKLAGNLFGNNVDSFENRMPSCRRCNHYKRAYTLAEFRKIIMTLHERLMKNYINKVAFDYGIIKIHPFDGKFYFEKIIE